MPTEMIIMMEEYFGGLKRIHEELKENRLLFTALSAKVTTAVLAECDVNGVVPLTTASVTELVTTL